jgi:hypothetical protein
MLTHRVTSPLLLGLSSANGFSSNADEIQNSSLLFNNVVIKPYQELIIDALDEMFAVNNFSLNLYFKTIEPLEFMDIDNTLDNEVIEEETGIKQEEDEVELLEASRQCFNNIDDKELNTIAEELIALGEDEDLENYEIVDEREVDYDTEESLDKMLNLASTGVARPKAKSEQDGTSKQESQKDVLFKVRYSYAPNKASGNSREFCKKMTSANKIYRKEDIIMMGDKAVNAGFGEKGADTYSIWLYKGGARCHHKWFRKTYMLKDGVQSEITTGQARSKGFKAPVNEQKVPVAPNDMPLKGFSPNNNNLPKDVR